MSVEVIRQYTCNICGQGPLSFRDNDRPGLWTDAKFYIDEDGDKFFDQHEVAICPQCQPRLKSLLSGAIPTTHEG